jgi:hypothetical protein
MDELSCPTCRTDEHLEGIRDGDVIQITCRACGLTWERDPSPTCRECGTRDDIQTVSRPVIQKARGSQLSIVGMQVVHLCYPCFRIDEQERGYRHIPPDENPATGHGPG